jgi:hypothetical protein
MSITRLQQARQMYAMGQRVAKTLDGSRPGYRGSDYGDQARGTGAYSGGDSSPAAGGTQGGGTGSGNQNTGGGSNDDRSSALQTFNTQKATGQIDRDSVFTGPLNKREQVQQAFRNFRPEAPKIPLGFGSLVMNMINPGGKGALQMFSDFNASKNRPFFMDEVVRAGKIDGLNYGTVADMTESELEAAYQNYLSNRLSGATDAYGNPTGNDDGGGASDQGIATLYNYDMFDDIETENANDPFASRYLQNQPDDIREEIESRMQNYYTV